MANTLKKTLHLDSDLLKKAKEACGATTDTETIRRGLEALIRHASYQRLRSYLGTEPDALDVPRRREMGALPLEPMILVDTSVWIRALSNHPSYRTELDRLLESDEVLGHELVYGELLIGDTGGRRQMLAEYTGMMWARSVPHEEAVSLVRFRKLNGQGIGWVDVHLLASALVDRAPLWTADSKLQEAAATIGVAHRPE